jgi:hypothetical protein
MSDPWHIASGWDKMPSARNRGKMASHLRHAYHSLHRAIWHLERGDRRRALRELIWYDENNVNFHLSRGRERLMGERRHDG